LSPQPCPPRRSSDLGCAPRRFWPEGRYNLVSRLYIGAADQVDTVRHGGKDARHCRLALLVAQALQGFLDGFGLTRQIDNKRGMIDRKSTRLNSSHVK